MREGSSSETGEVHLPGLPAGAYRLRAEKPGYNPVVIESLTVPVGQTVTERIVLTPAVVVEKLEVRGEPEALQPAAATQNIALGGDRIEEAPSQNRNYLSFVLTAPAVAHSPGTSTGRSAAGLRNPANDSGFAFNGMRGRNNSISIDGADNRDETTGGNRVAIGLEMVQEFRVAGTAVDAEFGGAAGGMVNMVTRAGQNIWHGDFTFFHQNEHLNARSAETASDRRPYARRWQPGFSTGGPVRRDRTFFFTALEQTWENVEEWSDAPQRLLDQIAAALRGPAFRNAPVHSAVRELFPSGERDTEFSAKAAHLLTPSQTLSARYAFSRGRVRNDVQAGDNLPDWSARGSSLITDHSLVAEWSAARGSGWINEARAQVAQRGAEITPNVSGPQYDIPGVLTLGQQARLDQQRRERHLEFSDTVQSVRGRHLLSAGVSVHGVFFDGGLAAPYNGIYSFPTFSDFLAGRPDIAIRSFGERRTAYSTTPVGLWTQDRWLLATGLSMVMGVRYDWQRLPAPLGVSNGNVAPRLGIAWQPGGKSGWVFRLGTGLFYDRYPLEYLNPAIQRDGVRGYDVYLAGADAARAFLLAAGGPMAAPSDPALRSFYFASRPFSATYARKVALGVERRLDRDTTLTVEFSDVHGLHLPRIRNAALGLPPRYALEQAARTDYRGAAVTLNRRLSHEFTCLASYNFSRTEDNGSDFDEQPSNPANAALDWGPSRQHQKNRATLSMVWEIPADGLPAPKPLKEALDRITVAPVLAYGSRRPLNTLLATDALRTGAYPITARPEGVPRNIASLPGSVSFDLRVMKTLSVRHDRALMQFGVESFNLLNHTNPVRVIPYLGPAFGGLIEAGNPRQVQLFAQFEY